MLRVDEYGLTVQAPWRTPQPRIERFLQSTRLAVLDWYRRHAWMNFEARLAFYAQQLRLAAPRFFLSGARSRWGSCNASGRIGLNWRLIQAPQFVIDYVVVHELAYLREMNHSRRFWSIVAEAFPRHAEARAHLDERGRWYLAI